MRERNTRLAGNLTVARITPQLEHALVDLPEP
jgi:hypothetical protein